MLNDASMGASPPFCALATALSLPDLLPRAFPPALARLSPADTFSLPPEQSSLALAPLRVHQPAIMMLVPTAPNLVAVFASLALTKSVVPPLTDVLLLRVPCMVDLASGGELDMFSSKWSSLNLF